MSKFEGAPCIGLSPLFDVTTWRDASVALNDGCRVCPFRQECLREVNPAKTWYDGVVGGIVWQNGKPLVREYNHLHPLHRPYADFEALAEYQTWLLRGSDERTSD